MPLLPGDKLGPYEILGTIGAGGMGEVYKARDTRLDRIVAVKRLKGQHSARFEQEARAIAALNHPHICQIHDIGPDYLVLEYIEGHPLKGPVSVEETVRLALQVAAALEEAHARGILHRDLKPANIMVTTKGSAKLLDFGLAKLTADAEATQTIAVMGTLAYMAPEQAEGNLVDQRSDVFSFGVVLYELLSGRRPFETLAAVLRDDPKPLDAPPALSHLVLRCLAKDPAARFQSITDLRIALEQIPTKSVDRQPSIAVLPFANMSDDKEQEYFSDGLAEEIINALAQIPGLKVIARTSAFAFRGKEQDIRKIAEALGVDTILEGSVRRAGPRVRITAQLITAADGSHLWSQRYDREMEDVFAVQDEVAAAIAGVLQAKLAQPHREAQPAVPRQHTPRLAAYEAYLKARHFQWQTTSESLALSRECYLQSIALDPEFAVARCAYADYLHLTAMMQDVPAREAMPRAREEARKALELDPSLPDAHAILGVIAVSYDYDWIEAERRFSMAMVREPVPAQVRAWYGYFFLMCGGRPQKAVEELERALHEDPLSSIFRSSLGTALCAAGRYDDAQAQLRQVLQINPTHFAALSMLSLIHELQGEQAEALTLAEQAHLLAPQSPFVIGALAGRLMRSGNSSRAQALLGLLGDGQAYGTPVGLSIFHQLCGEDEKAAQWLDKAIEQRHPLVLIMLNGAGKSLWRANRYLPALLRKVNLPGRAKID